MDSLSFQFSALVLGSDSHRDQRYGHTREEVLVERTMMKSCEAGRWRIGYNESLFLIMNISFPISLFLYFRGTKTQVSSNASAFLDRASTISKLQSQVKDVRFNVDSLREGVER